jgi:CheY-like chemotaxis protein
MLIADDDPSIVKLLADRCAAVGFEVETATNGIQALIKATRNRPDVLVIVVNMPEADGLAVCARLLDPSKGSLNVIVITGGRENVTVERSEALGAYYVRKGPAFWSSLGVALTALFPAMVDRIKELGRQPMRGEMRERSCVLVIDDDPATRQFLSSRLDKCGVELLFASDIGQGFRMACREAPSVILSDHFPPERGYSIPPVKAANDAGNPEHPGVCAERAGYRGDWRTKPDAGGLRQTGRGGHFQKTIRHEPAFRSAGENMRI